MRFDCLFGQHKPVLPAARCLIFGVSPVARALSRVARAMDFAVDVADPAADKEAFPEAERIWTAGGAPPSASRLFAVVATMGERDEEALLAAIGAEPAYLGVVASARRFAQIRDAVLRRGASAEALARVKNPAGLDIGARTPEEIAVSILAEIVQERRRAAEEPATETAVSKEAVDPICGMTVEVASARHVADVKGRTWYFCCAGCRERFLASPEKYAASAGGGTAR